MEKPDLQVQRKAPHSATAGRVVIFLWLLILLPRVIYFNLGPDTRRLSDTHLAPMALSFLQHAHDGSIIQYLTSDNKYPPLNGVIIAVPIALHYLFLHMRGIFLGPSDFATAYVLRETSVYFWIQGLMLTINILAILFILSAAKSFQREGQKRSYLYSLLLIAVSSYTFSFSTIPRIHSLVLLGSAVTLWGSFRLAKKKSIGRYVVAFGGACFSVAVSQTGITTLVLPALASLIHESPESKSPRIVWRNALRAKTLILYLSATLLSILLGYPRIILTLLNSQGAPSLYHAFVSAHHPTLATFGQNWLPHMTQHSFINGEIVAGLGFIIFLLLVAKRGVSGKCI